MNLPQLALVLLLAAPLFAAKLTPDQMCSVNIGDLQIKNADLAAELAATQKALATAQKQLLFATACSDAGIGVKDCEIKSDGTISKRTPEPATTPAAPSAK